MKPDDKLFCIKRAIKACRLLVKHLRTDLKRQERLLAYMIKQQKAGKETWITCDPRLGHFLSIL